jgi:predicted nuclease of predicted toxin-antitoxin system
MRLLLDENTPKTIVEVLRNCGYDVLWIREYCRGMADEEIVRLSMSENRVILT